MERDNSRNLQKVAEDIDKTLEKIKGFPEEVLETVSRLKDLIEEFHRIALVKIVRFMKSSEEGKKILLEMVKDPDIYALFLKHNIVKPDKKTQVAKVLEMIRPYIRSHGGDVELVEVKEHTVYIRLKGACQGCSQVSVTLKEGILEALKHHVPGIKDVKLVEDKPVEAFIDTREEKVWKRTYKLADLKEGCLMTYKDKDIDVILINWRGRIYAYRNSCAHQGLPLTGGDVTKRGTLICPWHGFEYDIVSGECINAPHIQLEPVPVRIEGEWVLISV